MIATLAATGAVLANVWMVTKTLKAQEKQYLRDPKIRAYEEFMYDFQEACDTQSANDLVRKTTAEIALNRAIAMIDLFGPIGVYQSIRKAHKYAENPRNDDHRNFHLDNINSEFRRDVGVIGEYL